MCCSVFLILFFFIYLLILLFCSFFFFFFQAEDGIRDTSVTGVQTCALPISAGLLVVALFSAGAALWFRRSQRLEEDRPVEKGILTGWLCIAVAVVVFAVAAIATQTVFDNYLVTADEYLADFQSRSFLR